VTIWTGYRPGGVPKAAPAEAEAREPVVPR
jgi:hypothetical protein